jgi:UDP-N-acetylmuramoyl-L-alanyl-D-glutamate--2,6-diaminopimelate ligase
VKASEIAAIIEGSEIIGTDREFSRLQGDSRAAMAGDAFIALKGSLSDGHAYIENAVKAGAEVVICNRGTSLTSPDVTYIPVPDTRDALESILPALFPRACKPRLIGITGTSGKTTTTYLVESILKAAGMNPGVIGTIDMRYGGLSITANNTTPGPIELYESLDTMARSSVDAVAMEVSSHSLDQDRINGLTFACAVFTNLSQDHLDYHRDMDTYFLAKKKLFDGKYLNGPAIINADDIYGQRLIDEIPGAMTYGRKNDGAIRTRSLRNTPDGMILSLSSPLGELTMRAHLLGEINAYNVMAAVGAAIALGIGKEAVIKGIESLLNVPGRMEPVRNSHGLTIIVDYAHKPDALKNALSCARTLTRGRLISVFGCGGERDKTKRPVMGAIAADMSDLSIVTSDNPRSEEPAAIIDDILRGIPDPTYVMVEPDREAAIRLGITSMKEGDCLIIAGKGHETYQIIGSKKTSFDDRECVRKCLREIYGS